jgi:hypothetical protein
MATRIHMQNLQKIGHNLLYWAWTDRSLVYIVYIYVITCKMYIYCTLYIVKDWPVLSSERAPHINKPATLRQKKKICSEVPNGYLTLRQTGRLTVGRNIILTLNSCTIGGFSRTQLHEVISVVCYYLITLKYYVKMTDLVFHKWAHFWYFEWCGSDNV